MRGLRKCAGIAEVRLCGPRAWGLRGKCTGGARVGYVVVVAVVEDGTCGAGHVARREDVSGACGVLLPPVEGCSGARGCGGRVRLHMRRTRMIMSSNAPGRRARGIVHHQGVARRRLSWTNFGVEDKFCRRGQILSSETRTSRAAGIRSYSSPHAMFLERGVEVLRTIELFSISSGYVEGAIFCSEDNATNAHFSTEFIRWNFNIFQLKIYAMKYGKNWRCIEICGRASKHGRDGRESASSRFSFG